MKPEFVALWLACQACGHRWDDWQPSMVPVEVWVAHIKSLRCPKCGAKASKLTSRSQPLEAGQ